MQLVFEQVRYEAHSSIKAVRYTNEKFDVPWHYHPAYELVLVVRGQGKRVIGNATRHFGPGALVFVGSGVPHLTVDGEAQNEQGVEVVVVQFPADLLDPATLNRAEFGNIQRVLRQSHKGVFVEEVSGTAIEQAMLAVLEAQGLQRYTALLEVLDQIETDMRYEVLSDVPFHANAMLNPADRFEQIQHFIRANYHSALSVDDVAQHVHMHKASFCRFFKRFTGQTFTAYLNELRVNRACKLLREGTYTIAHVGFACGFNSTSHFYRQFKRLTGTTPKRYEHDFRALKVSPESIATFKR